MMFSKPTFTSLLLLASTALSAPLAPRQPSSSKRGICFDSGSPGAIDLFSTPKITWAYNWSNRHWGAGSLPSNIVEYVPMCWGNKKTSHGWEECEALKTAVLSGSEKPAHVLGFNEPDIPFPQADMDPGTSVAMWNQYLQPLKGKTKLGAPSVSNSEDEGKGVNWLRSFLSQCQGCHFDFFPVHWYSDGGADVEYFKSCVNKARQAAMDAGHPGQVWVTELGVTNVEPAVQMDFMAKAIAWMEEPEQSWIERYSYYGAMPGDVRMAYMVEGNADTGYKLNSVGGQYIQV